MICSVALDINSQLRSNLCPTPGSETRRIQMRLHHSREKLALYSAQLRALQCVIQHLREQLAVVSHSIAESQSLLAPIRCLPWEILSEIFSIYCNSDDFPLGAPYGALRIGSVCAHWRHITISTPTLWSQIVICDRPMRQELLELFIHRSVQVPLRIDINPGPGRIPHKYIHLLEILLRESHRWLRAEITIPPESADLRRGLLTALNGKLPVLERIHLGFLSHDGLEVNSLQLARRLWYLSIMGWDGHTIPVYYPTQIRQLKLDCCHIQASLEFIQNSPELVSATLIDQSFGDSDISAVTSDLQILSLVNEGGWMDEQTLVQGLDALTLPSLKALSIADLYDSRLTFSLGWTESLMSCLERSSSSSSLTSLTLRFMPMSDQTLLQILSALPLLLQLTVEDSHSYGNVRYGNPSCLAVTNALVNGLTLVDVASQMRKPPLVPNLKSLFLAPSSEIEIVPTMFVSMVSSRVGRSGIREVTLDVKGRVRSRTEYDSLGRFDAAGTKIIVSDTDGPVFPTTPD